MAEFLVAVRDLPSGYRRGDPICAQRNGYPWTRTENPAATRGPASTEARAAFVVIKIPGLDLSRAHELVDVLTEPAVFGDPEFFAPDPEDRFILRARRKTQFVLDDLPIVERTKVDDVGELTDALTTLRPIIRKVAYDPATKASEVTDVLEFPPVARSR